MAPIAGDWQEALKGEFHQPYYAKLYKTVMTEYRTRKIFPPPEDMFNAFHFTPLHQVKVVILGQDPYHNDGQAHGLCFSVKKVWETPPSLVNIYMNLRMIWDVISQTTVIWKMGKAGRASFEHSADCTCTSGQFPQRNRLGTVYRCGHPDPGPGGSPDRVSSLGAACSDEGIHAS